MKTSIEGRIHRLRSYMNIYAIYPRGGRPVGSDDEALPDLFRDYDSRLSEKLRKGDILVAGKCFGVGPFHKEAILALKKSGVACIVAGSFGRQFYRSAINEGMPLLVLPEAREKLKDGEIVKVDFDNCELCFRREILKFEPFPEPIKSILSSGGLLSYLKADSERRNHKGGGSRPTK